MLPFGGSFGPVVSVVRRGARSEHPAHEHPEEQLLYPEHGCVMLETEGSVVRLAPDRAAWIPSGRTHSVLIDRSFCYHSLYVRPGFVAPSAFRVIHVRPLLRELVLDAARWIEAGGCREAELRKAQVLRDEIQMAPRLSAGIDIPEDRRLAKICRLLEEDPGDPRPLSDWARVANASEKTLQRLFVARTGLTFQQWRACVRMNRATEMQARGIRLIDIALAVGYSTESAFCQAFKKFYGKSPKRFSGS